MAADISLHHQFSQLKDPRIDRRKRHQLTDIIIIAICAVVAGADDFQQIEAFGKKRRDWLSKFLDLPNGIPSHDTFERLFARLDPLAFQRCFVAWLQGLHKAVGGDHFAIDGKTLRGSADSKNGLGPLHLVSAWACHAKLSLGQVACEEKSNEITAIPKLLELLDLKGALVTIDAMGCQKGIAKKVVDGGGDYVLTVKENQPHLLQDIVSCFAKAIEDDFEGVEHYREVTEDVGHGRHEKRYYNVIVNPEGIRDKDQWEKLTVIGHCHSERTVNGKTSTEDRYFIGSKEANAKYYGLALRGHWGIENNLHWQLDVSFSEDDSRVLNRNGAQNLALIRRVALGLLKAHKAKGSIATKRFCAALDDTFLEEILGDTILGKL